MKPWLEFAELLCGSTTVADAETGALVPMFTIQILAFPPRSSALPNRVALPEVLVSQHQFRHLLEAIQEALGTYFPEATAALPSGQGSGGPTPPPAIQ